MRNCHGCKGHCCTRYRVPITDADLKRLQSSGMAPKDFVDWLPVGDLYSTYPDVRLEDGYHYLVIAHRPDHSCILSSAGREGLRCSIHGMHPYLCRLYPFSQGGNPISHRVCDWDVDPWENIECLVNDRIRECEEYAAKVRLWNSSRRVGRKTGDFLEYILSR
ncbi:MAG: YkgJ family cysteine cluster protein [Candidatus Altiarchaeota archaeon]